MIAAVSIPFLEITLFAFILFTAIATAMLKDVLAAIIVFGAYSLGMAINYVLLLAPDVGMTEAAVSVGITTIFLLVTVAKTLHPDHEEILESINFKVLGIALLFLLVLITNLTHIPELGSSDTNSINNPVTQHYFDNTYDDTGVTNMVTAVLAGYRGFDTFGEAIVVFSAGVAILLILRRLDFIEA